MDKPMSTSVTNWGTILAGIGGIVVLVLKAHQSHAQIDYDTLIPAIVTIVGLVVAAIGARRVVGKAIVAIRDAGNKTAVAVQDAGDKNVVAVQKAGIAKAGKS